MKKCLIIAGGEYSPPLENIEYDYCIAVDKGYEYAMRMEIKPDVILGDFDSLSQTDKQAIKVLKDAGHIHTFPKEKDDTDTLLAVKHAIEIGCKEIVIICALGGRLDHTIANIQCMKYASTRTVKCEIISGNEWLRTITAADGRVRLPKRDGWSLSLFSLSDKCEGLNIEGTKYTAEDIVLTNDFPLGHGNDWVMEEGIISIKKGVIIVVESKCSV